MPLSDDALPMLSAECGAGLEEQSRRAGTYAVVATLVAGAGIAMLASTLTTPALPAYRWLAFGLGLLATIASLWVVLSTGRLYAPNPLAIIDKAKDGGMLPLEIERLLFDHKQAAYDANEEVIASMHLRLAIAVASAIATIVVCGALLLHHPVQ